MRPNNVISGFILRAVLFVAGLWVRLNDLFQSTEPTAPDTISPLTRLERAHKNYEDFLKFGDKADRAKARDEASKAARELERMSDL